MENNNSKQNKYEKMYEKMINYEQALHEKNQRRIKIGLKLIIIIPLIFLFVMFFTRSSKIIFLVLWIVSLFLIAAYLILIEYLDYRMQEELLEIKDEENTEINALLGEDLAVVQERIKSAKEQFDAKIYAKMKEELEEEQEEEQEVNITEEENGKEPDSEKDN